MGVTEFYRDPQDPAALRRWRPRIRISGAMEYGRLKIRHKAH
jgi:hypothetical protein